jgi:hypothetical protein
MEQAEIRALLEKYWQAETSVEEERMLAEYFRGMEVAPEPGMAADLEPARGVFAWREEEAGLKPGLDFDSRMLRRIGVAEGGGSQGSGGRVVRGFSFRFAAAAAIILCLGIGLSIPMISPGPGEGVSRAPSEKIRIIEKDTYTDPNQALAAVRQALLVASARINEGKHITQQNITRLHDSWQAATGD